MKIKEIQLLTSQLSVLEDFYTQRLYFKITRKNSDSISFQAGNSILTFIQSSTTTEPYHFAFNIPSQSIIECYDCYKDKLKFLDNVENPKIQPPVYDFTDWNAKALYFLDPDNNILEFIAREDIDIPLKSPFTNQNIINISEVGIVVDNALKAANEYKEKYGISTFSRSKGSSSFHPLGNDTGLLILVQEKRIWYTTNFKAKKQFSRIRMEMNGKEFDFSTK